MLNQPVNQLQPGPPSFADHQYGPPAVGYAEVSSAIEKPTSRTNPQRIGQPNAMPAGPPAVHANEKFVKTPARAERTGNEIAKLRQPLHGRARSWPEASSAS